MKINYEELQLQRREEILKSGHYSRIEIIVPPISFENDGRDIPFIKVENKKVSNLTYAYLLKVLQDITERLLEDKELKKLKELIEEMTSKTTIIIPKE